MNFKGIFLSSTSDDASASIQAYFDEHAPELFKLYNKTDVRLPFLEFPEKYVGAPEGMPIICLSRHSSKASVNSITVHPVGNFTTNDIGGKEKDIAPSAPEIQTAILRKMSESYSGDRYQITFEATHHGPQSHNPLIFAEIGTERENWTDTVALDVLFRGITESVPSTSGNFVAAGGGHYAPKFSSYVLNNDINIGHIISKFRMAEIGEEEIEMAISKTPGCKGFIVDKKGVKATGMNMIKNVSERHNMEIITI